MSVAFGGGVSRRIGKGRRVSGEASPPSEPLPVATAIATPLPSGHTTGAHTATARATSEAATVARTGRHHDIERCPAFRHDDVFFRLRCQCRPLSGSTARASTCTELGT